MRGVSTSWWSRCCEVVPDWQIKSLSDKPDDKLDRLLMLVWCWTVSLILHRYRRETFRRTQGVIIIIVISTISFIIFICQSKELFRCFIKCLSFGCSIPLLAANLCVQPAVYCNKHNHHWPWHKSFIPVYEPPEWWGLLGGSCVPNHTEYTLNR